MASKSDMPVIVNPPLPQILQNVFDSHWPTFEKEDEPREEGRQKPKKGRDDE